MSIPRIIHLTWKTSQLPEGLEPYRLSWIRENPGYEVRLWSDDDNERLVREHYPALLPLYQSLASGVHRADLCRLLYLQRFGGLYVDTDIECIRPVDTLLAQGGCMLGSEPTIHALRLRGMPIVTCNAAMASEPGHPFWQKAVDEIVERSRAKPGHRDPVWATGPLALQAAYDRWGAELGVEVLPPDAFFPLPDLENKRLGLTESELAHYRAMIALRRYPAATFGAHHWAHTWIRGQGLRNAKNQALSAGSRMRRVLSGETTIDEVVRASRYQVEFPEEAFPVRPERTAEHEARVREGETLARGSSAAIAFLIHDRIDLALLSTARLDRMAALFGDAKVFVLCDDSTDGTERVFADWCAASDGRVINVPAPKIRERGYSKMSVLRNTLLEAIEAQGAFDFVLMMDGDLEGPISERGLLQCLPRLVGPHAFAGVSAFGVNNWFGLDRQMPFFGYGYYDPLAFREKVPERVAPDLRVRLRLLGVRRGDAPIPAISGFAGLAVFAGKAIAGLRYPVPTDDCEHVGFGRALAARGLRQAVDPSLLLLAGRQGHHGARPTSGALSAPAASGTH